MMVSGLDTAACWPASPYFGMRVCDPGAHCLPACCPVSGVWSSHPEGQLLVSLVPRKVSSQCPWALVVAVWDGEEG